MICAIVDAFHFKVTTNDDDDIVTAVNDDKDKVVVTGENNNDNENLSLTIHIILNLTVAYKGECVSFFTLF